jgi:1,4-alpha-glucan branching enzyme
VWAPHASSVFVGGDFNGWRKDAHPLLPQSDGHWAIQVPTARAGQKYKFLIEDEWRIDPRARLVTNSVGDGVISESTFHWSAADYTSVPWNEMVIYEMHAGTFPDEPVECERALDAIISDLWYLKDLGISTIHMLPTGEFPGDLSWGYNPSHIFAVESSYGGPSALKRLIDAAHSWGLGVVIDVVYNHLGPNDLSIWQFDGWCESYQGEEMGGIYFYNDWRARTPWGHKNRPDYGRPEVRQFLLDNAMMWLEEFRADGLRFDATNYIRNVDGRDAVFDDPANLDGWGWNLLRWINDEVDRRSPWKITIAEDMQNNNYITKATKSDGAGFDCQWDALFVHTMRDVLTTPDDRDRDLDKVRAAIEHRFNGNPMQRVIYSESHDEVSAANGKRRLPDDIQPGYADGYYARKRSTLGAALVLTSPGIPMIFQGQEILEWVPFGDEHPMDWGKYDQFRGIYHLYRDLIKLRRNVHGTTQGLTSPHVNVFHVNNSDKVLAFHRWNHGGVRDDVVVVCNFSARGFADYQIGFPRSGRWRVRFNSDWKGYSADFGSIYSYDTETTEFARDGLPFAANVGLGPYAAVILSQD